MLNGITVKLITRTQTGVNDMNEPVYTTAEENVDDVLVSPLSDEEQADSLNLTGRRATYQLGLPKGDSHTWVNSFVEFFGRRYRVIGEPTEGIEAMIPLRWNKKVKVEMVDGK